MSRPLNPKQLEIQIKKETDIKRKRQLEKELKFAERERDKRLKDFQKRASLPSTNLADLEKAVAKEPDQMSAKKMKTLLEQVKKDRIKEMKKAGPMTAAATPQGLSPAQAKRESQKRLDKFDNLVKKKPNDIKILTKLMKAEPDKPTQKTMAQTIKKLEIEQKKRDSMKSAATSPATPRPAAGPSGAANAKADEKAALQRLKKLERDANTIKTSLDYKKLEKVAKTERDPKVKTKMIQLLKKAKSKLKP